MIASNGSHKTDMKKNLTNVKNKFLKKSLSRKTLLMTISRVVYRKDIKKQNVKNQKIFFFLGKTVFQKTIQRIVSIGLHKKNMTNTNLKLEKTFFLFPFFDMKLS